MKPNNLPYPLCALLLNVSAFRIGRTYNILTVSLVERSDSSTCCSIVTIQLYKYTDAGKYETLTTLHCSGTKHLLTSWLSFSDTRRERHNFYYADCTIWPKKCAAHPVAPKISVSRDLQNSIVRLQLQLSASMVDKPTVSYIIPSHPPAELNWPSPESNLN